MAASIVVNNFDALVDELVEISEGQTEAFSFFSGPGTDQTYCMLTNVNGVQAFHCED